MVRIAFGDLAGLRPSADDLGLLIDELLQRTLQLVFDMRRALQHLVCKQPAFARKVARQFQLAANIAADFSLRIALGIEGAKRLKPSIEHPVDQRPMHRPPWYGK